METTSQMRKSLTKAEYHIVYRVENANRNGRYGGYPLPPDKANPNNRAKVDKMEREGWIALEPGKGWIVPGIHSMIFRPMKAIGIDGRTYLY